MTKTSFIGFLKSLLAVEPSNSEPGGEDIAVPIEVRTELMLRAMHGTDREFSAEERRVAKARVLDAMAADLAKGVAERNAARKLQKSQKVVAQQPMTLLLAAADQASEGVENSEATKEALMQLETLVTNQGSITFWQDGSSVYVSFDDAVSVQCIELVGFEEQPFNLVRSIANPNLFEVGKLTVEAACYFLELRLYNPERYKVIIRWQL